MKIVDWIKKTNEITYNIAIVKLEIQQEMSYKTSMQIFNL